MDIALMRRRPYSRRTFERNMHGLVEMARAGRLHIRQGLPIDDLLRVRSLPNGRLDFLSVDESTRLKANMFASMSAEGIGEQDDEEDDAEADRKREDTSTSRGGKKLTRKKRKEMKAKKKR